MSTVMGHTSVSRVPTRAPDLSRPSHSSAKTAPDSDVPAGRPVDPDLRKRTLGHWLDTCQFSGGQGVAGSNPAVPAIFERPWNH
jgi:hypothetical protein